MTVSISLHLKLSFRYLASPWRLECFPPGECGGGEDVRQIVTQQHSVDWIVWRSCQEQVSQSLLNFEMKSIRSHPSSDSKSMLICISCIP